MSLTFLFTGVEAPPIFEGIPACIAEPSAPKVDLCKMAYEGLEKRAEKRRNQAKRYKRKWNPVVGEKILVKDRTLSSKAKTDMLK